MTLAALISVLAGWDEDLKVVDKKGHAITGARLVDDKVVLLSRGNRSVSD